MDFTCEVSKAFNLSPFDVLSQDKDKVIMLINYFIEKGETSGKPVNTKKVISKKDDGFWNF